MDNLLEATYKAETQHFWFKGLRRFVRTFLDLARHDGPKPRILDCGCGTGANLGVLADYGHPVGLDFTAVGLKFAQNYGHRHLTQANVVKLPFADQSFGIVTALDVLTNLEDGEQPLAIREMWRVLEPGGSLIVNVAALNILRGNHSVFGSERRRYRRTEVRRLLTDAGFIIERLTYTNFSLFPLMLAVRFVQRMAGLPTPLEAGTDLALPPAGVNAVLSGMVALEARALQVTNMPVGSSVLCLARKPRAESEPRP